MEIEIERKFLVNPDKWHAPPKGIAIRQGYLSDHPDRAVRIRMQGDGGWITIKGRTQGVSRAEYEYQIPGIDAAELLELCPQVLEKTRYRVEVGSHIWDVDEFYGDNEGLVLAEIELSTEDEAFEMPTWAGEEVSGDFRYFNTHLAKHPFGTWSKQGPPFPDSR